MYFELDKDLNFSEPGQWYKTEHIQKYPFNRQIAAADILYGYEPSDRFIGRETKVLAMGSCFAEHFIRLLAQQGYNQWSLPAERHPSALADLLISFWGAFENLFVILQQFRWAFEDFTPKANLWYTKDKRYFEATQDRRARVRYALENAEVFVITLGLSEVWFDTVENEPMWRTIPIGAYEPGRHVNRRVTVDETVRAFYELDRIADRHLPGRKFIFTLSPIPLWATFRKQSAVSANVISKAILRAAIDQFMQDPSIPAKNRYFYYPSYELILGLFESPFLPDNIHVRPSVVNSILEIFKHLYTDLPSAGLEIPATEPYVRELERQLQIADRELIAKEQVIQELDRAARERLEILIRLGVQPPGQALTGLRFIEE
jgi:hypothetical protein